MKLDKTKKMILSGQFADWYYLRTGQLATTDRGEAARSAFLMGELVTVKTNPKGGFEVYVGENRKKTKEKPVRPYKKF